MLYCTLLRIACAAAAVLAITAGCRLPTLHFLPFLPPLSVRYRGSLSWISRLRGHTTSCQPPVTHLRLPLRGSRFYRLPFTVLVPTCTCAFAFLPRLPTTLVWITCCRSYCLRLPAARYPVLRHTIYRFCYVLPSLPFMLPFTLANVNALPRRFTATCAVVRTVTTYIALCASFADCWLPTTRNKTGSNHTVAVTSAFHHNA